MQGANQRIGKFTLGVVCINMRKEKLKEINLF